jgi:hypothetical protein
MSGLRVIARTAGTESSAKTMSVVFDQRKSHKQRRCDETSSFSPPELGTLQYRADVHDARDPGGADVTRLPHNTSLTLLGEQHPPRGKQDEGRKRVHDPVKALDEPDPGGDHQCPEDERAGDAPS